MNEQELLCRLIKGDMLAFDALYRHYFNAIYNNIFKLTRDQSATEDLLQEVFITLWEKREKVKVDRSLGGWLFVMSYNKSVNFLRKQLRESLAFQHLQIVESNPEETMLSESQYELLEQAMAQLSPQRRKVFELCKIQGKTYEETAAILQLSKHTVKEYLSAAMNLVKDHVREHAVSSVTISAGLLYFLLSQGL